METSDNYIFGALYFLELWLNGALRHKSILNVQNSYLDGIQAYVKVTPITELKENMEENIWRLRLSKHLES